MFTLKRITSYLANLFIPMAYVPYLGALFNINFLKVRFSAFPHIL